MRTLITVAAALAMLVGGQAYGQYSIEYTVELGGNNHADQYHMGAFPPYDRDPNGDQDGKIYNVGDVLNWAVVVAVTGVDENSVPSAGAANLVFDLELHLGTADGPLVGVGHSTDPATIGGFFSNINDGSTDIDGTRTNDVQNAAFATAFNVDGHGSDGGRLWDTLASGGPNLDFKTYPSAAGYPAASTAALGTCVGMGAGYQELVWGGSTADEDRVGVGIADDTAYCTALGVKALFEGQISTVGLTGDPAGTTYVLVLKAGTGNNVIPGDTEQFPICDPGILGGKFAIAASAVVEDTISFQLIGIGNPCDAPVMTAAQSVKTHGAAGDFGIDLLAKASESRADGATKVVVTFDKDIALVTGTAADVAVTAGTVASVAAAGPVLTVTLTGNPAATQVIMSFPGVAAAQDGCVGVALTESQLCIANLKGDYNNDKAVNVLDLIQVRNRQNTTPDATTCRGDVNVDGAINVLDLIQVRNLQNTAVTACP